MKTIKIANVDIDIHDGPIGIVMSGGADSSVLFYILMKYATGPIHVFSCANGKTNNREPYGALNIINRCIELTGRKDIFFYSYWEDHKLLHNMINTTIVSSANVNVVYGGFTRPPPKDAIVDFDTTTTYGSVDVPGKTNLHYYENNRLYYPFANINKKGIAELYKTLDIEDLYSHTRSCESPTLLTGHCNKCWWCKERIWAFGYLD
jgi:7-cyano-7-deazaguanine synthase in queuosine biosynthesis